MCNDRRQYGEYGRPEDTEQQRSFAAEPLCQYSAGDLRRHVAVEERCQHDALFLLIPVEFTFLYIKSYTSPGIKKNFGSMTKFASHFFEVEVLLLLILQYK